MTQTKKEHTPCRYIRTKAFAVNKEANISYVERDVNTENYWCIRTMHATGPDDAPVLPSNCGEGRGCYHVMPKLMKR